MELRKGIEKEYKDYVNSLGLNPITSEKYCAYFGQFLEMFDYNINQKFIDNFIQLKKFDPNHRAMIKHLLDFLKRDDALNQEQQLEVSRIVMLKQRGRKTKKEKPILTKEQIRMIIEKGSIVGSSLKTTLFRLMVVFQYSMALRVSELCQLRFSMLKNSSDIGGYKKIKLPANITKTKVDDYVYLEKKHYQSYRDLLNELKKLSPDYYESIINDDKTLWLNLSTTWFAGHFTQQVYKILGIKRTSHCLRHSKATHLLQGGIPVEQVQKYLRHSDISSTSVYLHQISEQLEKTLIET